MVKDHAIKYHKKLSSRPALAPGSTLNDRPPRLHRALWSLHNSPPLRAAHVTTLPFYGVRPVIGDGPKSHTTITISSKGARTCLLIQQLLILELRHAGIM
ncbi:hypothetical protein AVEN_147904-1 [Araneus ventricosus]|uniref:Uncharacterized protein n=1 Tax=Araneus ventricosus TaxID=182803 RepID=A0A4Y2DX01_ARAVE|nr:hypothetical protein AVEN_147904-1 [Araneus ventricosus]